MNVTDPLGLTAVVASDGADLNSNDYTIGSQQVVDEFIAFYDQLRDDLGPDSQITVEITGGDRYRDADDDQGIHSRSNDDVVDDSSQTSPHLEGHGRRAVDFQ